MLYYLDRKDRKALRPLRGTTLAALGWLEKDLENLVAEHITRFVTENQLFIVAQSSAFQEEPDIMALHREGRLHIFELKRWQSSAVNLLQVLRYGQKFGLHDYRDINEIFARYHRRRGKVAAGEQAPELRDAHARYFELVTPLQFERFNHDQRFVVMTNGLDRATREAIAYWGAKKLDVQPLLYRVYETEGKDLLIEIDAYRTEFDDGQDSAVSRGSDGPVPANCLHPACRGPGVHPQAACREGSSNQAEAGLMDTSGVDQGTSRARSRDGESVPKYQPPWGIRADFGPSFGILVTSPRA